MWPGVSTRSTSRVGSGPDHHLQGLTVVHQPVALGGLVERQHPVEDQAGVDRAVEHLGDGLFQIGPDGRRAAVLWNDTDENQPVSLSLEGARWNSWASPEGEGSGIPAFIKPQGAMLIYEA